jgi:hypothetical protein
MADRYGGQGIILPRKGRYQGSGTPEEIGPPPQIPSGAWWPGKKTKRKAAAKKSA